MKFSSVCASGKASGKWAGVIAALALAQLVGATQANAAGFEKGVMWGARSAGSAGIAAPYIAGSQALYFNPAGIANDKEGQDVSLNLSPTWLQFKGPINDQNTQATSDQTMSMPFGLIYGMTINDKLGFAIGGFTSGGAKAEYNQVAFPTTSAPNANVSVRTDLMINELSIGAGYKVTDALKLGVAYRIVMARANFGLVHRTTAGADFNAVYTGLKDTEWNGFRLGAQYKFDEKTRVGLVYRSEINLSADGQDGGSVIYGANTIPLDTNPATVKTTFPMQLNLAAEREFENWRALIQYDWTQYSRVGDVNVTGAISAAGLGSNPSPNVTLNWHDEHQIRLAGEYLGFSWPIRFGYYWASAVSDKSRALPTFTPPASGNTLTLGTGQIFTVAERPLQFDAAGEYSFSSADGGTGQVGDTTTDNRAGTYAVNAMALHLGLTYAF